MPEISEQRQRDISIDVTRFLFELAAEGDRSAVVLLIFEKLMSHLLLEKYPENKLL